MLQRGIIFVLFRTVRSFCQSHFNGSNHLFSSWWKCLVLLETDLASTPSTTFDMDIGQTSKWTKLSYKKSSKITANNKSNTSQVHKMHVNFLKISLFIRTLRAWFCPTWAAKCEASSHRRGRNKKKSRWNSLFAPDWEINYLQRTDDLRVRALDLFLWYETSWQSSNSIE